MCVHVRADADVRQGKLVNYKDLPNIVVDTLLPRHFGVVVLPKVAASMLKQAGTYSKVHC